MIKDQYAPISCPRVAHVSGYIGACYGGIPEVILALCRETGFLGASVSVWATTDSEDHLVPAWRGIPMNLYAKHWPKWWFRSPELIRNLVESFSQIDVLHLHGVWTYVQQASAHVARSSDMPYILTPHGVLKPARLRLKSFKKRLYLSLMAKRVLASSACLHAFTSSEADEFRNLGYEGPITLIPNGVDISDDDTDLLCEQADRVWPILRNNRVILFLSRFSPEKGLDQLLPAFRDVVTHKSYDDAVLVLAGSGRGSFAKRIRRLTANLGIDGHVVWPGFVTGYKKALLMSRADIYTLPSLCEGFSMSILENLAKGTPVLITPGCDFPEVSEVGAGLCRPPTRGDLADGLKTLLDMPDEQARTMGCRGRRLVQEKYTWPIIARKLMTVYDCIIQGKSIPLHPEPMALESA